MPKMTNLARPNMDIEAEIGDIVAHYPPLQADRRQLHIEVRDGTVTLSGHVKTPINRRYLVDRVAHVRGVHSVNSDHLYSEEAIRIEAGQRIPMGVIANATYGTVILTGTLPDGKSAADVVQDVALIDGVQQV